MSAPDFEAPSLNGEITQDQVDIFVARLRELLDPPPPSHRPITDEEVENIVAQIPEIEAWLREAQKGLEAVIELDARALYYLDGDTILIGESDTIGLPFHIAKAMIIKPPQHVDDGHYSITKINYEVDLTSYRPRFEEKSEIYDQKTKERLPTPMQDLLRAQGTTWTDVEKAVTQQMKDAAAFGLNCFSQARFEEVMQLLSQLGPHNRVS